MRTWHRTFWDNVITAGILILLMFPQGKKLSMETSPSKKTSVQLTHWNQTNLLEMTAFQLNLSKCVKNVLSKNIATVFNYMIEQRAFPDARSGGIRSAVFKSGKRKVVDNFRGITILSIMEKVFEAVLYRRLAFVNDAFASHDKYNNAFIEGNRTSDNLFVLNGSVEKQLTINKRLYVCYIDFSKVFDMVNRTIIFYKLRSSGWRGRVMTLFGAFMVKPTSRLNVMGGLVGLLRII